MTNTDRTESLKQLTVWQLAGMAGVASPDGEDSPGALFLTGIRDDVAERLDYDPDTSAENMAEDAVPEIADGAPDVYTYTMWREFVDLAAWREDPSDFGFDGGDMDQGARICLYMIADRLAASLFGQVAEEEAADEDEDEDEDEHATAN